MALNINCVYGRIHINSIKNSLIKTLVNSDVGNIKLNLLSYDPDVSGAFDGYEVESIDIEDHPNDVWLGFGEAHNVLANKIGTEFFIIVNPDCFFFKDTIKNIVDAWNASGGDVGIIEGRQWPFEHPKKNNRITGEVSWASGAFCLIDTLKFKNIGGFDVRYFMYIEDVDLSWRMWLKGHRVIYCKSSVIAHFTGLHHYKADRVSLEEYYSLRNHILISAKFFGKDFAEGQLAAVKRKVSQELFRRIQDDLDKMKDIYDQLIGECLHKQHPMIAVKGIGVYSD